MPDFALADAEAVRTITPRQLLNHTSGIEGDYVNDTGRGDDCLARYVEGARTVGLTNPPGVTMPGFAPAGEPVAVRTEPFLGSYRREGFLMTIADGDGGPGTLRLTHEGADGLAGTFDPLVWHLTPVSRTPAKTVFAGRRNEKDAWIPVVFYALADGSRYVHFGVRATAKSA
ncbi:hypothetical protein [Kitasatospora sp. NPDC058218]|uniref:hypothetical protein n=1 Tax=Kitasatospora sp. NPDC058218 TaxID=3346385 RepID=UPI0036D9EDF0